MAFADLTTYDAALKDDYLPPLREAVNNSEQSLLPLIRRNDEDIVGRQAVWSVHVGRSSATGARAENAALPTPDRQRFAQMKEDLAFLYHTIKVSGPALRLTRNDQGAFVRALDAEMRGAKNDLLSDVMRQVFGQKVNVGGVLYSGAIADVTAVNAGAGELTLGNATTSEMRVFFVGEAIDVINPTTGASRGTATITAVDVANKKLTVDAVPSGTSSGDYVARAGSFKNEINGLRHLVHTTQPFAGVDPATVPAWAAVAVGSSTTVISEELLEQAHEKIETDGNGETAGLFIFEHAQRRKLAATLQAQKRYEGRQMTLTAGWVGLQVARGTMVVHRFCPNTTGFLVNQDELVWFVGQDWDWDSEGGSVLYKALDGSDAYEARLIAYVNLVTVTRNAHCRITVQAQS